VTEQVPAKAGDAGLLASGTPAPAPLAVPGEVWILPPEEQGNDKPDRRHAVVAPVYPRAPGTAVYGSTSPMARDRFRSPTCVVVKRPETNGLNQDTLFYPTKLSCVYADELERRVGVLDAADYNALRLRLREGLGIGTKRFCDAPEHRHSWRGRIVEVREDATPGRWLQYALVVTCHEHSAFRYYQVVVPLLTSDPALDHPLDVVVSKGPLVRLLGNGQQPVVFSIPLTTTLFHRAEVAGDPKITVSPYLLGRVEDSLCKYLDCELPIP
jgi:hypothetical protein